MARMRCWLELVRRELRQVLIKRYGFARSLFGFARSVHKRNVTVSAKVRIGVSKARVRERIVAIFLYCPVVVTYGGKQVFAGATLGKRKSLHVILESFKVLRWALGKLLTLGTAQLQAQLLGNLFRDLFLHREYVGDLAMVLLPPEFRSI